MTRHRGFPTTRPIPMGLALSLLASAWPAGSARAAGASAWALSAQSRARLIDAGPSSHAPVLLAGLEIGLAPHFITYWRDPGDAGVPPRFSFAGSTNLKSAAVRYPAPRSLDEAGAKAFGYERGVIFPIEVEPIDPSRPVELAVALDYAACHEICLPAHADLGLRLDGEAGVEAGVEAVRVRAALAAVPRPSALGASGPPSIAAVRPDADGGFSVEVDVAEPATDGLTLFVEGPEGWAYGAGSPVGAGNGRAAFPVKLLEHPGGALRPTEPVVLTLVAPGGAVETAVRLQAPASTR